MDRATPAPTILHSGPDRRAGSAARERRIARSTPVRLLALQLHSLADALPVLDDYGREAALAPVVDRALATLRIECRPKLAEMDSLHGAGMWSAANRFIEMHLVDHDLNPAMVALALRCSRAWLYRLFQRHDQTVMGSIQEARWQRSHRLPSDPNCRLPIADLAWLCGFGDPSSFTRGFKRRFGRLPRDVRLGQA